MKLLVVTYRFGKDLIGGAESHLRRLLIELAARGVEVVVATTTARDLEEIGAWAAVWKPGYPPGEDWMDGLRVLRYPSVNPPRGGLLRGSARLHRMMQALDWRHRVPCALPEGAVALGRGWSVLLFPPG